MNAGEAWEYFREAMDGAARFIESGMRARPSLVVQFGSSVAPPLQHSSDVDVLFVFPELPAGRAERFALVHDFEEHLAGALAALSAAGFHYEVSPLVRGEESLRRFSPLYLDLPTRSRLLYDPRGLGKELITRTESFIRRNGTRRDVVNGLPVWIYRPGLPKGEHFVDDF